MDSPTFAPPFDSCYLRDDEQMLYSSTQSLKNEIFMEPELAQIAQLGERNLDQIYLNQPTLESPPIQNSYTPQTFSFFSELPEATQSDFVTEPPLKEDLSLEDVRHFLKEIENPAEVQYADTQAASQTFIQTTDYAIPYQINDAQTVEPQQRPSCEMVESFFQSQQQIVKTEENNLSLPAFSSFYPNIQNQTCATTNTMPIHQPQEPFFGVLMTPQPSPGPSAKTRHGSRGPRKRKAPDQELSPEEAAKKEQRRDKNRIAATKCRIKKQIEAEQTEIMAEHLENEAIFLKNMEHQLLEEKQYLEYVLQSHQCVLSPYT